MVALLYGLLWRLLLLLLRFRTALLSRLRLRSARVRLWERAAAALLLPAAGSGGPVGRDRDRDRDPDRDPHRDPHQDPDRDPDSPRHRWLCDGRALEKLPAHVGLVVAEEEPSYADVASLVVWCTALGVSCVSVYDHHGVIQKNCSRLQREIARRRRQLLGVDGSRYDVELLVEDGDRVQQYIVSCRPTVKVLSPEDGKFSIVQAAKQLCHSVENKERSSRDISVSTLDKLLREAKNIPDPELVLKFGPVNSTLGFLPWHIRLSEFVSLPSHRNLSYEDLLGALQRYAACQQRLGQ